MTSSQPSAPDAAATLLSRWVDAFNARDLDGMLALMGRRVRLQPLRVNGLDRIYEGHGGIEIWLEQMRESGLEQRFAVDSIRADGREAIGVGEARLGPDVDPVWFWMLNRVEGGLIVSAHHYLTDPGAFPKGGLEPAA